MTSWLPLFKSGWQLTVMIDFFIWFCTLVIILHKYLLFYFCHFHLSFIFSVKNIIINSNEGAQIVGYFRLENLVCSSTPFSEYPVVLSYTCLYCMHVHVLSSSLVGTISRGYHVTRQMVVYTSTNWTIATAKCLQRSLCIQRVKRVSNSEIGLHFDTARNRLKTNEKSFHVSANEFRRVY